MRAGVHPAPDRALGIAGEDQRSAAHRAGLEVVGFLQLRLMAEVEPAGVEDLLLLDGKYGWGHHGWAGDQGTARLLVVDDVPRHGRPPLRVLQFSLAQRRRCTQLRVPADGIDWRR